MRLMTPIADDCHSVWASTPVKTKASRSIPLASPKPACRLVPSTPMKIIGKTRSATRRARSRSSLTRSRWAMASTAESSCIGRLLRFGLGLPDDLEVGVLEARHVRLDDVQRRVDRLEHRMGTPPVELDPVRPLAGVGEPKPAELGDERPAVRRVDQDVLLHEIGLDGRRRP